MILEALNVRVVGSGNTYVVFAHGFGMDQSVWHRILPYFTSHYRVILFDQACSGSVNPDYFDFLRYTSLNAYVEDLFHILDSLQVTSCVYVGHSISALTGMLASVHRPELFTKLILIGASPRYLNDQDYQGGFQPEDIQQLLAAMEVNYLAWANGFAPRLIGADCPVAIEEFARTLFNMGPDIWRFVTRVVFSTDLRGILSLVRVPCYIMQAANDITVPPFAATYLSDHLGGPITVMWLETDGHLPKLRAPAYSADRILEALRTR